MCKVSCVLPIQSCLFLEIFSNSSLPCLLILNIIILLLRLLMYSQFYVCFNHTSEVFWLISLLSDFLTNIFSQLYEQILAENEKLKAQLHDTNMELTDLKLQLEKTTQVCQKQKSMYFTNNVDNKPEAPQPMGCSSLGISFVFYPKMGMENFSLSKEKEVQDSGLQL